VVFKLGGSVLTGLSAYRSAADFLACEHQRRPDRRIVAVVSAEFGHTDALEREARHLAPSPDATALDLLWATGELRSVALLALALRSSGIRATGLNAHEAGLRAADEAPNPRCHALAVRAALAAHDVVVVPGFLATRYQQLVTLGRGGSDLSAVLIASALDAAECVLIKDVDGYFTADPATQADARPIRALTYPEALTMAQAGCPLVQPQALEAGRRARISLVVRSAAGAGTTVFDPHLVHTGDRHHGLRH
jgi:aspartate kinase